MTQPAKARPLVMTSCEVFEVIEQIAQAKGKAKEKLLAEYIDDPMMERVLKATYDPFTTYGIKQVPESDIAGSEGFSDHTFELLDRLASRVLTGNSAKAEIITELNLLSDQSKALLTRILKKDLRAGFTAGTCNRVQPGFIFVFECMRAHKFEEKRIKKWPVAVEPKYDGVRSLVIWDGKEATFYSRTGRVFEGMKPMADLLVERLTLHKIPPMVLDGELMDRSNQFNKIVGDVHKKDFAIETAVFYLFDAIPLEDFKAGSDASTYRERRMRLSQIAQKTRLLELPCFKVTQARVMHSKEEIEDWAAQIINQGGEGVIVKTLDGRYEKKRSYQWLKIKAEESVDLEVVDVEPGTGKYEGMIGALVVDFNGVRVSVGSGLTDDLRALDETQLVGRMIEVMYHEVTPDGSLRHPRFKRFRDDKPASDGHGV